VLAEVTHILNNKARPALLGGLQLINRPVAELQNDPQGVRAELLSVAQDLDEVLTSLDRIAAGDTESQPELAGVLGDPTVFKELISMLRNFGDSLDSADAARLQRSKSMLQNQRARALSWINECNRRIAGPRMAVDTTTPGSGT